ncbi:adenosine deaminase AGSA-like isoform X1 [Lytechinus variegatus]|uniref:adenosine deaminase AGSA-like isoform X1 n=2 Tax=Lytechinus variegatus TaxID=7654 RepID=UPI001BB21F17|nr:adenosine deaminase AGSA-like isoform X1 [Lytechinus variegatus]
MVKRPIQGELVAYINRKRCLSFLTIRIFNMNGEMLLIILLLCGAAKVQCHPMYRETNSTYMTKRNEFLEKEAGVVVGSSLVLNEKEKKLNDFLLSAKKGEVSRGFKTTFPPAVNFLKGKPLVENSTVFQIIRRMPKGGILHIHEISMANASWVVQNITYLPHLYYCVTDDYYSSLHFNFSATPPSQSPPDCVTEWMSVASARARMGAELFDQMLHHNITMAAQNPDVAYPNITMSWLRFGTALHSLTELFFTTSAFRLFMWHSLERMIRDNVQYVEIRTLLYPLQDLDGSTSTQERTLQEYIRVLQDFKNQYPDDFVGGKIILSSLRYPVNRTLVEDQLNLAMDFRKKYPEFFAGYDLVGEEDSGGPLIAYINELLTPSQLGVDLPFFFHAGETDWEGEFVDRNLIDAVLLNTSRIGHGYAINKHPVVMETIKSKGIAIELNPISNQILHLVHDLRDHVGAGLIADDFPVVVSSDDPIVWEALPLSHDYYMAFMAMSGESTGLTLLKQLAINTIKYSAMTQAEKSAASTLWQAKWDRFITEMIAMYISRRSPID